MKIKQNVQWPTHTTVDINIHPGPILYTAAFEGDSFFTLSDRKLRNFSSSNRTTMNRPIDNLLMQPEFWSRNRVLPLPIYM